MPRIISRNTQLAHRNNDPFSPLRVDNSVSYGSGVEKLFTLNSGVTPDDSILDGVNVSSRQTAAIWEEENKVHRALRISQDIESTRFLLGRQVIALRDDINLLTYTIVVEKDRLTLSTMQGEQITEKVVVFEGFTQRAHLAINKFTGKTFVLHASKIGEDTLLFLNGSKIETTSNSIDFPYLVFSQESIGHIQREEPTFALISYKCRDTGKLYVREYKNDVFGKELELNAPSCIGGVDFEINDEAVLFRIDALEQDQLVTKTASSADGGHTITNFSNLDLSDFSSGAVLPESSGVVKDYFGNFQIPVTVLKDKKRHLLDILSDDTIVSALELPGRGFGSVLARFPKKGSGTHASLGKGNGITDGIGIIATGLSEGKLFSSNSQSGGFHFPEARLLNHEMPKIFSFKPTDNCYTRAAKANQVSMDYLFLESDDSGNPISNELFIDSWDMPLPTPKLMATAKDNVITVELLSDGWFEEGKTTFDISDPKISINKVVIVTDRKAEIQCDTIKLSGSILYFEMKNRFYWHKSSCFVD